MEGPKRLGRPPRIDVDAIAEAALDIGFEQVTMRRVAEHLGVSVPGLYHHVRGREDLVRLAAERALSRFALPDDDGRPWAEWLRAWARYIRGALSARPELVQHFMGGGLDEGRLASVVGVALAALGRQGLDEHQAAAAWGTVGAFALGVAVEDIRARTAGRPVDDAAFEERLTIVLAGVAARLGLELPA